VLLAPLAGVSDHPFRRTCTRAGADLTYVEMLSATALCFGSQRTYDMMKRHESEALLGVQLTGKSADETARAVEILAKHSFETIDINMGCPVAKVVGSGCGSAILKDPERVHETVRLARQATDKPLSVKIRLGWDARTRTYLEVGDAAQSAGAAWLTVHGRLRSDDYATPVDLPRIAELKARLRIPVIGNGNVFSRQDAQTMQAATGVDGVMISRGALGNPWVFREIKTGSPLVTLAEWHEAVENHLIWQQETYGEGGYGAVCMRKHLLWYLKGWPGAKRMRERLSQTDSLATARAALAEFVRELEAQGVCERMSVTAEATGGRFVWDPKFDMDRKLDRGVGDDGMVAQA
jgi:nifR3 family TIM-barrel protein